MHHSSEPALRQTDRERMEIAAQQMKLGATGRHPLPPVVAEDQGEIQMGVSHDATRRKVYLNFGKPVAWVGMTLEQATDISNSLRDAVLACRGIKS